MQALLKNIEAFIQKEALFTRQDRLVVAVSGGLDSVVLCHILLALGYRIELAHMNFGLRGEESDRDEKFVQQLAADWKLVVHTKRINPGRDGKKGNIQEWARQERYTWLQEIIQPKNTGSTSRQKAYILTAHHADDQAETILLNLFRGSGIAGLSGMLPSRNGLCRPLLMVEKEALEAYAKQEQLSWVEDSSNATDKYTRNKIRHQLIPLVKEINKDGILRMYQNSRNLQSLAAYADEKMTRTLKKLVHINGEEQWLPIRQWKLLKGARYILFEWLYPLGFSPEQVEQAIGLMESQTGQYIRQGSYLLLKNREWLVLSPKKEEEQEWVVLEEEQGTVRFAGGELSWTSQPYAGQALPADAATAVLDAARVEFPLLLRRWKAGDYFYPLGMRKKKKIARFLIDQKISRLDKEKIWLLETGKRICWLAGQRPDDRFKVTTSTTRVILFQLNTGL
ncbi:tRNA lysidine(34) synthetase TilS [Flavihumibacter sp. CACIAM 22H1]|uniref:tRNA lysidine(34) synthetase TilS n=1 Tax=Flavihumibacter sp. CACIAM 22H1 TaxID=1812911 RepID=UPI0007A836D8|nr:tRNA lysidine(34) synthetase TilS [Flavihumibacter sp. CACIAM 22H1]KYP14774.1 MAG: hypothetical protein A1D16_05695 [Flavihumibacter sp. CACIAM 22H1]